MKRLLCVIFLVILFSSTVFANAGVFTGSGYTIELSSSKDIRMVSEDITIIPGRGRFLFDGTVSGMDRVEYYCKFVLKNLSKQKTTVKVGFPLDSQFLREEMAEQSIDDIVSDYSFIARAKNKTYHVSFQESDKKKQYYKLFVWNMEFDPEEKIELNISYKMPVSMTLATTDMKSRNDELLPEPLLQKYWYMDLTTSLLETFSYVTSTGSSWNGSIENAHFKVYIANFEDYLQRRGPTEASKITDEIDKEYEKSPEEKTAEELFYTKNCSFYREISPENWTENEGYIEWDYKDYKPGAPISFQYYFICGLPNNIEQVQRFIKAYDERRHFKGQQNHLSKEDISDLKEIIMAYMGICPKTKRVEQFVINQVWYNPNSKKTENDLSKENIAFLKELDELIMKTE